MFIDEAVINVKAGDGGNGCFSYERLKYKPKGSPDGGDGGRGGHIYVVGSAQIHTLQDTAYRQHYKASRGQHGKGSRKFGAKGEDVFIPVPLGTVIYDETSNEIIADCLKEGEQIIVAKGGRGGRGNGSLVSPRNPNPERSEPGKPGEEKKLRLVLKSLADVGLVGRPNAGKSTFLTKISRARPKIADYPFTTKEPHLGIVKMPWGHDSFVVADIPGLIEDCHKGKGLGIRFLRHIERTKVLVILVESSSEDPVADADVLIEEMGHYSKSLLEKPRYFILTKTDLLSEDKTQRIPEGWGAMSAVTGEGVNEVIAKISELVIKSRRENPDVIC
ncbi:MAG TPA: GTPase ObgE [Chitinispirillaceae bacterium]|jgi:GTP-binding protein|nr:GTPase ObgE [Chitinispirillaceae bacterium]